MLIGKLHNELYFFVLVILYIKAHKSVWVTVGSSLKAKCCFSVSVIHCLSLIWQLQWPPVFFSVQMWKRNTFCECVKWNDVYNEVLVELWEWLTSSHSFMLPNYKYAAWLFYVIPMMLTCHFHIINWRVDCVCVNVMDRQRYVFWIYSWSELVQYMCTMFLLGDPLNPGKISRSIHATLYLVPLGE